MLGDWCKVFSSEGEKDEVKWDDILNLDNYLIDLIWLDGKIRL